MYLCIDFESDLKPMYMTFDFKEFQFVEFNPEFHLFDKEGNDKVKYDVLMLNRDLPKKMISESHEGIKTNIVFFELDDSGVIEDNNACCMDEVYCFGVEFNQKQYIFDQQRLRRKSNISCLPNDLF